MEKMSMLIFGLCKDQIWCLCVLESHKNTLYVTHNRVKLSTHRIHIYTFPYFAFILWITSSIANWFSATNAVKPHILLCINGLERFEPSITFRCQQIKSSHWKQIEQEALHHISSHLPAPLYLSWALQLSVKLLGWGAAEPKSEPSSWEWSLHSVSCVWVRGGQHKGCWETDLWWYAPIRVQCELWLIKAQRL